MITLENQFMFAEIDLDVGGDIRTLVAKKIKKNLLLEISPPKISSMDNKELSCEEKFLAKYKGGWQLMFPNAGYCSTHNGIFYNYHGSVWDSTWELVELDKTHAKIALELDAFGFSLVRTLTLIESKFIVQDEILNKSKNKQLVIWGHHPAFSEELLASVTRITINANRLEIINQLPENKPLPIKLNRGTQGSLLFEPLPGFSGSFLGIISGFYDCENMVSIDCPKFGISINMNWDVEIFRNAWFWFENLNVKNDYWPNGISTFAIEPCSTSTNMGYANSVTNLSNLIELEGFESKRGHIVIEVLQCDSDIGDSISTVTGMEPIHEAV